MQFEAILRGANFRPIEAQALVMQLDEDAPLILQREPDNQFDPNAIQVIEPESEMHLGYVAKEVAAELAPLMDEGEDFLCTVGSRMSPKAFILNIVTVDESEAA